MDYHQIESCFLPDEYVKKIAFVANAYERENHYRPPDIAFILAAIDFMYEGICESIGHGVCEGGDQE